MLSSSQCNSLKVWTQIPVGHDNAFTPIQQFCFGPSVSIALVILLSWSCLVGIYLFINWGERIGYVDMPWTDDDKISNCAGFFGQGRGLFTVLKIQCQFGQGTDTALDKQNKLARHCDAVS